MEEGRTINLKELLHHILLKWRFLLLWMVIFAVLANCIAYFRSSQLVTGVEEQEEAIDYSQYESELTVREIEEVKKAVEDYSIYEKTYDDYRAYNSDSIKMQLDANSVPTKRLIYQISGNRNIKNISDTLVEILPNDTICEKILTATGWNKKASYVNELISVTNSHMSVISLGEQSISNVLENNNSDDDTALIVFHIIASSKDDCDIMGNVITEELTDVTAKLQEQFGNFEIQQISDYYCEEANRELLVDQQNCIAEMNNASTIMKNVKNTLTEQQQNYFSVLLDEKENIGNDSDDSTSSAVEESLKVQYFNVKYIIAGAIFGIFISCIYIIFKYIFNKHFISKCFVEQDLKCTYLGLFSEKEKRKKMGQKIDSWIDSFFEESDKKVLSEENLKMLCTRIRVLLKKNKIEKMYVTSSLESNEIKNFLDKLKECLNKDNVTFEVGESILNDANSLEKFAESDGVIFIEQMERSLMEEIVQEINCCKKYGVNNLGIIAVK